MKTLTLIVSLITFWTLNSCGQSENVNELLEKQETRNEIFNSILNSHELMTKFIHAMNNNEHAMMMMNNSGTMMGHNGHMGMDNDYQMMNQTQMNNLMHENPEMMYNIMSNMMDYCIQDSIACNNITNIMSEYPHMVQISMEKIKNKQMNMMNSENEKEEMHGH